MKTPYILLLLLSLLSLIACNQQPISPNSDLDGTWKISEVRTLSYFGQVDWYTQIDPPSQWIFDADSTATFQFSYRPLNQDSIVYHIDWSGMWDYDIVEDRIDLTGVETSVREDESTNQQTPQPDYNIDLRFQVEALQNDSLELTMTFGERETYWHFFLYR